MITPSVTDAASLRRPAGPRGHGGASSLLRIGAAPHIAVAPASFAQRPAVLGRQRFGGQQLSLFGPLGGR
jgi:hypothetical protein